MSATTLPIDIIFAEILPKLPCKSLARFKCVCKSFRTLICSTPFINIQLQHSLSSTNDRLLIYQKENQFFCSSLDSPEHDVELCLPRQRYHHHINDEATYSYDYFVGSCNGLICFCFYMQKRAKFPKAYCWNRYILLNPLTGIYKETLRDEVSDLNSWYPANVGFGFDSRVDDYKIVSIHNFKSNGKYFRQVKVYSFNNDCWRLVECKERFDFALGNEDNSGAVIENYLVHWMFMLKKTGEFRLGCFNVQDEIWVDDVPLLDLRYGSCSGVLDGCLCLLTLGPKVDVWVMKQYRVKESWTKLGVISDQHVCKSLQIDCPRIKIDRIDSLQGRSSCEIQIRKDCESKFCWYKFKDRTTNTSAFYRIPIKVRAYMCSASLFPVPNGKKLERKQPTFGIL